MQFLRKLKKSFIVLTLCTLGGAALQAQVTGAINGRVTDSSGAIVSGAKVTATNVSTNFAQGAVTDTAGEYHLLALSPGTYSVSIAATGFKTFTTNAIDVKVNDQQRIDAALTVGGVEQSVSVEANTVQVESDSTQLGDVIESKQMLAMPLNGRSYLDLMALQPGVTPVTAGTIPSDRPVSGQIGNPGNLSVNGQPESGNMFMVNGGDVSESKNMGAGLIPNLDSIAEFRLITNSFDAEYGKVSGAVMNSITKSGSNRIHGDAFEFLRNNALDATNYFDTSKAELRRNQFGFAVGGPFLKDRLFWFSDYQGTRQVQGASTGQGFLPTDAERAGQFDPTTLTGSVVGAGWANTLSQRTGTPVSANSTLTVGSSSIASGSSTTITATLRDVNGNPVPTGVTPTFTASGGTSSGTISSITNAGAGVYTAGVLVFGLSSVPHPYRSSSEWRRPRTHLGLRHAGRCEWRHAHYWQ